MYTYTSGYGATCVAGYDVIMVLHTIWGMLLGRTLHAMMDMMLGMVLHVMLL